MKNNKMALIFVILSIFFWGSNFNAGSQVVVVMSRFTAIYERFIMATLVIFIFMMIKDKDHIITFKLNWESFILLGLCGITGFNLAFFIVLQTASPNNSALIMTTSLIVSILDNISSHGRKALVC